MINCVNLCVKLGGPCSTELQQSTCQHFNFNRYQHVSSHFLINIPHIHGLTPLEFFPKQRPKPQIPNTALLLNAAKLNNFAFKNRHYLKPEARPWVREWYLLMVTRSRFLINPTLDSITWNPVPRWYFYACPHGKATVNIFLELKQIRIVQFTWPILNKVITSVHIKLATIYNTFITQVPILTTPNKRSLFPYPQGTTSEFNNFWNRNLHSTPLSRSG